MKRVALITDGWKRHLMYAWAHGIMCRIGEYREEVCLYHYNCHGNWSSEELHNLGEYNIYNLPALGDFDGIILDCNNITDQNQFDYVIELIKKSGVPTVSIARDIEGFYYGGIDNEKPIMTLMEHMYEVHGSRRFVFVGGPKDNYENEQRIKAYRQALEKFGLEEDDNPVFYGDYDFEDGLEFFETYIHEGRRLPEVFICACDNIAAGICTQAENMGYRVPQDFKVTGFDNLDKAAYFKPQITTVDHNRGSITYKCMQILIDIWEGKQPEKYNFIDTQCVYAESCGCPNNGTVDYRDYMKSHIISGVYKGREDERIATLQSSMAKCRRFEDMYRCMSDFFKGYDCDGYYVVVDDALTKAQSRSHMKIKGYNEANMSVVFARENDEELSFGSVAELNTYIEKTGGRNHYLFTPIHFKQYAIGYTILRNGRFLYDNSGYYDLHSILVKELEYLYSHTKLENMNKKLKEIYNKDQLTGMYNRTAYAELVAPTFKKYVEKGIMCAIGFIDVDNFKQINDVYGHDYGDEVLRRVAEILQDACPNDGYVCRYGGDEFILFFPCEDKTYADEIKMRINEAADTINMKLSIGVVLSEKAYGSDIKAYFEVADKNMYEEKLEHKRAKVIV